MRIPRKAFLNFTAWGLFLFCITTVVSAQTAAQIAEKALAATVYLEMTDRDGQTLGFGSGFFVEHNQVATNFQLIEGAAKGTATQVGKTTKYTIEGISATDEQNDLAILEIKGSEVEPLPLGDSDAVKTGEMVHLAGNPQGLEGSFSNDTISSVREADAQKRFQMTALIAPGNSGGPVLNEKGEAIGVSFMVLEGGPESQCCHSVKQSQGAARSVRRSEAFVAGQTVHIRRNASQVGLCQVQVGSI